MRAGTETISGRTFLESISSSARVRRETSSVFASEGGAAAVEEEGVGVAVGVGVDREVV